MPPRKLKFNPTYDTHLLIWVCPDNKFSWTFCGFSPVDDQGETLYFNSEKEAEEDARSNAPVIYQLTEVSDNG